MNQKSKVFNMLYITEILLIFSPTIGLIFDIEILNQYSFVLSFVGKLGAGITLLLEYQLSKAEERDTRNWWMDILAYYFLILAIGAFVPGYPYENIVDVLIVLLFALLFYKRWRRLDKELKIRKRF